MWDYVLLQPQTLHGAAYDICARHEFQNAGRECWLDAARFVELIGAREEKEIDNTTAAQVGCKHDAEETA